MFNYNKFLMTAKWNVWFNIGKVTLRDRFLAGVPLWDGMLNIALSNPCSHAARVLFHLWRETMQER